MNHLSVLTSRASWLLIIALLLMMAPAHAQVDGASVFTKKCLVCHGADGSGKTKMGSQLKIPDLRTDKVQKLADQELEDLINHGLIAPSISTNYTTFTEGTAGSFTVIANGLPAPVVSESGALPSGIVFNASTGVLSGTPAAGTAGSYPITVTAQNGVAPNSTQHFIITVIAANSPTGTVGSKDPRMPPRSGILTPEEIKALVVHIRSLAIKSKAS